MIRGFLVGQNKKMKLLLLMSFISINSIAHEDGGEKDIRCSVSYSSEEFLGGGGTFYTMTVQPTISMTFLNNHVDIGVLPKLKCLPSNEDEDVCFPWETAIPDLAPFVEFMGETKNGIQFIGKYAVLNFQDPPRIKPHPKKFENLTYITKEQYDEQETGLNYCVLVY